MTDELARMRERLATKVLAAHRIGSEGVAAALHAVPRHLFLPDQQPEAAYRDDAIVTKRDEAGQPISSSSQPAIMAIMLDQLDLAPGQTMVLTGATGAGKSTLLQLVPRLADPVSGAVRLDGTDIRHIPLERLRTAMEEGGGRHTTTAMANLAEAIQGLVAHMRTEQQMIRELADGQGEQNREIKRLLERLARQPEKS